MVNLVDGALGGTATVFAMYTAGKVPFYVGFAGYQRYVVQVVYPEMQFKFRLYTDVRLVTIHATASRAMG